MATYLELQKKQQAQKVFEELKADGAKLLAEGKIDELTYNTKVRDACPLNLLMHLIAYQELIYLFIGLVL